MSYFAEFILHSQCLCPRSNRYISGLEPPVELLRRNRLNICLGTDSLASNDRLSVFEEMRMFPGIPLPELLAWVVRGGAQALEWRMNSAK